MRSSITFNDKGITTTKTSYIATIMDKGGFEIYKVPVKNFEGDLKPDMEIWAKYFEWNENHEFRRYCEFSFHPKGKDKELFELGFYKVLKIYRTVTTDTTESIYACSKI